MQGLARGFDSQALFPPSCFHVCATSLSCLSLPCLCHVFAICHVLQPCLFSSLQYYYLPWRANPRANQATRTSNGTVRNPKDPPRFALGRRVLLRVQRGPLGLLRHVDIGLLPHEGLLVHPEDRPLRLHGLSRGLRPILADLLDAEDVRGKLKDPQVSLELLPKPVLPLPAE